MAPNPDLAPKKERALVIRLQAERDKLSVFVEKVATEKLGVIPYEIAHAARRLIGGPRKIGV